MPELCFYEAWTKKLPLPEEMEEPFKAGGKKRISVDPKCCSKYNARKKGKSATLHPPTLSAIFKLFQIEDRREKGAAGIQVANRSVNYFCLEYPIGDNLCIMTYNWKTGRFRGIRKTAEATKKIPGVFPDQSTGEEYLALLIYGSTLLDCPLYDDEFSACYQKLKRAIKMGSPKAETALMLAYRCCDNLYQRLTAGTEDAISFDPEQFRQEELDETISAFELDAGVYNPNECVIGEFEVLGVRKRHKKYTIAQMQKIYAGKFFGQTKEKERIPSLPDTYLVSQEAEEVVKMVTSTPARLFMMTGEAGTGKTTDARMIAQVLGLPYYVFTCGPGTDELELLASTVPNMGTKNPEPPVLPKFQDMQMDPASALCVLSNTYEEGISEEEAFSKILKLVYEKGYEQAMSEKAFMLKESEIIKACRLPSVLEIQEPAMIEKPGTLTRLNSLFDDGAVTDLINGEKIKRNKDTIVIMTTNLDYVGCGNFNQSVLSRMSLIQPKSELTAEEMRQRVILRTGFQNEDTLTFMISTVKKIREYLKEQDLQDGVCGYRELESWVLTFLALHDLKRSAMISVISKAVMEAEEQENLRKIFIDPYIEESQEVAA